MRRRDFVKMLGLAPVAIAVAKLLPKLEPKVWTPKYPATITPETLADAYRASLPMHDWRPSTCYAVGDCIVWHDGGVREVVAAGISGPDSMFDAGTVVTKPPMSFFDDGNGRPLPDHLHL